LIGVFVKLYGRKLTNEKLVENLMRMGLLNQAFVIEAIRVYSEQVLTLTKEEWGESNFINYEAWQERARECLSELGNRG
jgi:hypothetical protein